jgi:hypothetical protein
VKPSLGQRAWLLLAAGLLTSFLFDLAEDPGERHDIAATHLDIVADLVREAEVHRRDMVAGRPLFDELLPPEQGRAR